MVKINSQIDIFEQENIWLEDLENLLETDDIYSKFFILLDIIKIRTSFINFFTLLETSHG